MNFSFDGDFYHSVESSKYSHLNTYVLANYENKALTTGCQYGTVNAESECVKTELLNMETLQWSDGPDYPFTSTLDLKTKFNFLKCRFSAIYLYSATQTSDAAYIIGGMNAQNIIAEFKNDQWRQLDDLNTKRRAHGSITLRSQTMIIGGYADSE